MKILGEETDNLLKGGLEKKEDKKEIKIKKNYNILRYS
jgi:hypothetical protein